MCFTLGAVLVKGGKVISSGFNHHRPHYDGSEAKTRGHRKPISMHAEMHAIFNLTGMSPSFKTQVQENERRVPQSTRVQGAPPEPRTKAKQTKGCAGPEWWLSGPCESAASSSSSLLFGEQEQPAPFAAELQPDARSWT